MGGTASLMSWFNNRGVSTRIFAAIGVAAVVSVLVGGIGLIALSRTNNEADGLYATNVATIEIASNLRRSVLEMRLDATNQALSADTREISQFDAATREADLGTRSAGQLASAGPHLGRGQRARHRSRRRSNSVRRRSATKQMLPAGAADDYAAWRAGARTPRAQAITTMEQTPWPPSVQGELAAGG